MTKKVVALLGLCMMLSLLVQAQSKEEKKVAAAVEKLKQAMISGERKDLEAVTSNSLSYGHSSGKLEDKAAFVQAIVSGQSDFISIDLANQTVQVTGKTAIVRHQLSGQTNDSDKPGTVKLGVLLVWAKEGGDWRLLARQAYKL
ncbi:nuclear transport factor 2 family protein [Rufibacter tibetensis]|uniref:DUF4440 domain-containing protein n=1 Tax=Rufibacter tibetensis TaxID=512763 RepID=A0A0P0CT14_9BACT|nr:nuclear transport factor 2 family protein [Rufibacter tibetensis]ALI98326.1 hypothetical protein DC20_04155 [Rufibacter tibetensis]